MCAVVNYFICRVGSMSQASAAVEAPPTAVPSSRSKGKYWCLTINNPTEEDWPWTDEQVNETCVYTIRGNEVCLNVL